MTAIVVAGALANKPFNGGEAWVRLSWALGLRKLGFEVYFVEQIGRNTCVDAAGNITSFEHSVNLTYFRHVTDQFGLKGSSALIYADAEHVDGMAYGQLLEIAEVAALLVNISGHLYLPALMSRLRRKAYIDIDPGFTQFWYAAGNPELQLSGHDVYFTIGENIGTSACPIPTCDIQWRHTRQPVVLEHWPIAAGGDRARFTTVASWRGPYGPVEHEGRTYGLKVHEWRKFLTLPEQVRQHFEVALQIHPADERDLRLLERHGWQIVDPRVAAPDPIAFRRYVQSSGAEFSVAQGAYVATQSGWFSDRTARYLASGKPALVQDTGFGRYLPVGEGLITFSTLEQAIAGAGQMLLDYKRHCAAARALAETYFESNLVLGQMLEEIL